MLSPKRTKFRKQQKGRRGGPAKGGVRLDFGQFGLQALNRGYMTAQQIEAVRIAINRHIKRGGQIWIRVFPDKPVCKKPAETRMGKGKGTPEGWVAVIKPGRVLFELDGVVETVAREAIRLAANKLPFSTRFILRGEIL
ncbi:MAG: 50S ribosomal protein L16 [Candidatus Adiutrix intracellularis]|nr:MAG: 50S ribosomal protein L16 [Candidatus Adiutrix intracellularis]MDR2826676.1 50S ribosomal protein L16 [Candidatus Adiutrix intracellularis]